MARYVREFFLSLVAVHGASRQSPAANQVLTLAEFCDKRSARILTAPHFRLSSAALTCRFVLRSSCKGETLNAAREEPSIHGLVPMGHVFERPSNDIDKLLLWDLSL